MKKKLNELKKEGYVSMIDDRSENLLGGRHRNTHIEIMITDELV